MARDHANVPSAATVRTPVPAVKEVCPGNRTHGVTCSPTRSVVVPDTRTTRVSDASRDPVIWIAFTTDGDGVTAFDGADQAPQPAPFNARTVNVYDVPFVRPDTVHVSAGAFTKQLPPVGAEATS